ncbi:hypothetical protein BT69DRAFT_1270384 [Atractiella rhizophila]|nr:hypothetical protein BT69DRAFT_1270384 [Atractiella rhizophila]
MRPAASQAETKIIKGINAELKKEATLSFLCGNYQPADLGMEHASIFYREAPEGNAAKVLTLPAYGEEALAAFHNSATVSPHGQGNKTIYDDSVRVAKEFKIPNFALNFDPLHEKTGILQAINDFLVPPGEDEEDERKIYAELYKINSYSIGGFFKPHRDTPKSDQHLGTIVVCLPSTFKGGEFLIGEDNEIQTLKWDEDCSAGKHCWVFLYSDVQHEVKPVTSGYRITIAYDVFIGSSTKENSPRNVDISAVPLYAALKNALRDESFFKEGGKLSWAMHYGYPVDRDAHGSDLSGRLKGRDRLLYNVLSFLNLKFKIQAVYETDDDDYDNSSDKDLEPLDKFWPDTRRGSLLIGGNFLAGEDDYVEDGPTQSLRDAGMRFDPDIVWCQKPRHFVRGGTYISYGNEASISHHYVAACIVVDIPRFGDEARKF